MSIKKARVNFTEWVAIKQDDEGRDIYVPTQFATEGGQLGTNSVITSSTGQEPLIGVFGEILTGKKKDDVNVKFIYPFYNTTYDLQPLENTGDGNAVVSGGLLTVSSTTGTALVQSKNAVRYRSGHTGFGDFTASFVGDGTGEIGLFDDQDGFKIRVVNGVMSVLRKKGGADFNVVSQENFNGFVDFTKLDLTKINIFRIVFGYLGVANCQFLVRQDNKWKLLHYLTTENLLGGTTVNNPNFPISVATSGAMVVKSASWNGGVLDGADLNEAGSRYFSSNITETLATTTLATMGTFRNKATYKTLNNKVKAKLLKANFFIDPPESGNGVVEIKVIKNAIIGTPTWSDVDVDNSVIERDNTANYTSGGQTILTEWLPYSSATGNNPKSGGLNDFNAEQLGLFLLPGEIATITAQNVVGNTNVNVRVSFNWIELF